MPKNTTTTHARYAALAHPACSARFQSTALECHHLDPMSERSDFIRKSTLADVIILCANCHRLVHSERRVLSIEVAKSLFKKKPFTLGELL
jgi:HNH endonuclease